MTRAARGTAFFYLVMFAAIGVHLPFWPIWLQDWGLSAGEVGLYVSLGTAVRVVAGFAIPVLADRLGQRRTVMAWTAGVAAAIFAGHALIGEKALLLAATLASGAAFAGLLPLGEALGAAAAQRHRFSYAPVRAVGSFGLLAMSLLIGSLGAALGSDAILATLTVLLAATALLAPAHPGGGGPRVPPPPWSAIGRLLLNPVFALFAVGAALTQSSHGVLYAYGSLHWRALGMSEGTIGALWAFAVAVEILVMLLFGQRLVERLGAVPTLARGAAAGVVRWGLMGFDPTGAGLWILQAGHAVTFAVAHLGAIAFISRAVPEQFGGSAQGAYTGLAGGVLQAGAMGLAALLYPALGGGTYWVAAGMSAAALAATLLLARRWDGRPLSVS